MQPARVTLRQRTPFSAASPAPTMQPARVTLRQSIQQIHQALALQDAAREGHAEAKFTVLLDKEGMAKDVAREGHAEAKASCVRRTSRPSSMQPVRVTLRQRCGVKDFTRADADAAREGHAEAKICLLLPSHTNGRCSPRGSR